MPTEPDEIEAPTVNIAAAGGRIFALALWLGLLWLSASVVLWIAASRVGVNADTTYGGAEHAFESSWGGRIAISPPEFWLTRAYQEQVVDPTLKQWITVDRTEDIPLHPVDVALTTSIHSGTQTSGWLSFDAYEAACREHFSLRNTTIYEGDVYIRVKRPDAAALLYDYTVSVGDTQVPDAVLGKSMRIGTAVPPGTDLALTVTLSTKGIDRFEFLLSHWSDQIVPHLSATLTVDSDRFSLVRFGLPHTRTVENGISTVAFDVSNFSSNQDIGITFVAATQILPRVAEAVDAAPLALALFLAVLFVWSQILRARFLAFHYLFAVLAPTTYFLFISYSVRYLALGTSLAIASILMLLLFGLTLPSALGQRFALRVALPYLLVLTVGFSAIFLLPIFKGVAFLAYTFVLGLSVLVPVARGNIAAWPIVVGPSADARV